MATGADAVIVVTLAAVYVGLLLVKAGLAWRIAGRRPALTSASTTGVVIVQPILSGDPALSETLETNVTTLRGVHFFWLVDRDDLAGQSICATLQARHLNASINCLVMDPPPPGVNPKLIKLERARAELDGRIMVVLDDDAQLPAHSLAHLIEALHTSTVSTALPAYVNAGTWSSGLLAQFVNNNAATTYLTMLAFGPAVSLNGMAYAIRAESLDHLGGFVSIRTALTDDLAVAELVQHSGGTLCQTAAPVWVRTTVADGRSYVRQMHRWHVFASLLLARQSAAVRCLIALVQSGPLWLWALLCATMAQPSGLSVAAAGVALLTRAMILTQLQRRIYRRSLHAPVLSIISELLQPLHLGHAWLQRTIVWRTRRYRVRADHTFGEAP